MVVKMKKENLGHFSVSVTLLVAAASLLYVTSAAVGECIEPEIDRQHGIVKLQNNSGYMHMTLQCFDGYTIRLDQNNFSPQKSLVLYCEDGYWTAQGKEGFLWPVADDALVCVPVREHTESICPVPENIPNGKFVVYNNDYELKEVPHNTTKYLHGYYVLYSCYYGYRLVGMADITCGYKGWLDSPPRCVAKDPIQEKQCDTPPNIDNAEKSQSGNSVSYTCNSGYDLANPSHKTLVCRDGAWIGTWPTCVSTCPAPEAIPNGKFTVYNNDYEMQEVPYFTTKFLYGYYVLYSCNYGYRLVGVADITCGYKGWLSSPPRCVPQGVRCPTLPDIKNGLCVCDTKSDLSLCKPFYEDHHIECVCEKGFKLFGESILTCKRTGDWDWDMPTCRKEEVIDTSSRPSSDSSNPTHMSTLAIVVATACSVLGVLLLIMVIMIFRRRKPRPPSRLCRQSSTPPPYSRVHNNDIDELDRYLLIGYENPNETPRVNLPSYEEAISCGHSQIGNRQDSVSRSDETQGQVGEYRPLPSIPGSFRANQMMSGENTSRHSIITTSTMNRDGVSELFGSIDTVNVSVSDASTAVTIETLDSATSHHSNMSRRATAGSIASENSNGSLVTEDVPLLDSTQREENDKSDDEGDGPNRDE